MRNEQQGLIIALLLLITGCQSLPTDRGQQYQDGYFTEPVKEAEQLNITTAPVNKQSYQKQIKFVHDDARGNVYQANHLTYQAIQKWLHAGAEPRKLKQFGLVSYQLGGQDNYGNVFFTGYYTPVLNVRHSPQGDFIYPLYRMPKLPQDQQLPSRAEIDRGVLGAKYILAYSSSLIDNFLMQVQGSGYVDFEDGQPPVYYGYAGKNSYPYTSIGRLLVQRGEINAKNISAKAIRQWAGQHPDELVPLLEQNASYVFFHPEHNGLVKGASGIPLIAQTAVATDKTLIPPGSVLLAQVPLINEHGQFDGKYQIRLLVALDIGGAIRGQHLDLYEGIGKEAGELSGFYNHFGRVWLLKAGDHSKHHFNK